MRSLCIAIGCIAGLAIFSLSACQSAEQVAVSQFQVTEKVNRGMTPDQVRTALGKPVRVEKDNGEVKWMVYGTGAHRTLIYFADGAVKNMPGSQRGSLGETAEN